MDRGDRGQIFRLGVDPDRFGHAPDEQVETQKFQQALVNPGGVAPVSFRSGGQSNVSISLQSRS